MTQIKHIGPLPQIGFGTWNRNGDEAYKTTLWALEAGYRHIDTAEGYHNEEDVGRGIAASGVPRADIFLTTKVAPEHLGPGQVMPHVEASLKKLRTEMVDLLLVHWPSVNDTYDITDYMAQFAAVQDAGLARHIGVSNFTKKHLDAAVTILGDRPIATNQVEIHVLLQNRIIVDHTHAKGISTTAYSPLARGSVSNMPKLQDIGARHGVNAEQVALAFLMAEGHVVIPSSSKKERIISNLAAKDVALTADEIALIRTLDEGRRFIKGSWSPVWDT
jgi:2,5-diketo-D-gluconate reductase B